VGAPALATMWHKRRPSKNKTEPCAARKSDISKIDQSFCACTELSTGLPSTMSISRKNVRDVVRHDYQMCRDRLMAFDRQAANLSSELGAIRRHMDHLANLIIFCTNRPSIDPVELEGLQLEKRDYLVRASLLAGTLEGIAQSKMRVEAQKERLRKELQEIEWLIDRD